MTKDRSFGKVELIRRILGFAGIPFISLLIPFLFLPILARVAGADAWLAIAIGQSIGGFLTLFVALGYNTVGPTIVAMAKESERPKILRESLPARLLLLAPATVISITLSLLIAPVNHRIEATAMSIAVLLAGLSSAWYMIGLGRPRQIVVFELLPRLMGTVLASGLLIMIGQVIWYPLALIVAVILGNGFYLWRELARTRADTPSGKSVFQVIRDGLSAMSIEVIGGTFNSLAVTFVSLTAVPNQAANYVSGDKLYRIGQYSDSALGNALQGWVVEDARGNFARRARTAVLFHFALGLLGLAGFLTLGTWLTGFLFGSEVQIDESTAAGFGVAVLGMSLSTALGREILVGIDARREYLIGVSCAALLGVPTVLLLAGKFGAAGGSWGLAISEVILTIMLSGFVFKNRKSLRIRSNPPK